MALIIAHGKHRVFRTAPPTCRRHLPTERRVCPPPVRLRATLLSGDLADSVPPTGSTAGGALVSPTPPPGGSDRGLHQALEYHSPLEGESQKPSRMAKADAVGGARCVTRLLPSATPSPFIAVLIQCNSFCDAIPSEFSGKSRSKLRLCFGTVAPCRGWRSRRLQRPIDVREKSSYGKKSRPHGRG